jgi:hypothetical protein
MYSSTPIPIGDTTGQTLTTYPTMVPSTTGTTNTQYVDSKLNYNPGTGILSVNNLRYVNNGTATSHLPRSVQRYLDTPTTQAFTAYNRNQIADFNVTITPRSVRSKIFINVRWMGEFSNDNFVYNSMWGLTRNGSILGPAVNPGIRIWGIQTATQSYVTADNNSTPETVNFTFLDTPATTAPCTYAVTFLSYASITLYTNRTVGETDNNDYERGTSMISAIEVS